MLNRLTGLFRRSSPSGDRLDRVLDAIDTEARSAARDYQVILYNRAGNLCAEAGDQRALDYYGRAIDANLELGYFDSAAGMCRKIIDFSPAVVRARCTLAFLALGEGMLHLPSARLAVDARQQIDDYVQAAKRSGQERLAIERLRLMADVTDSRVLREQIAEHLLELGDSNGADEVFGRIYAEGNAPEASPRTDQRERWARALQTSVVHRVRRAPEEGDPRPADPSA